MSDNGANYKWAYLPKELLEIIGQHLDSPIDVYRFRAVCTSWRRSVSPSYRQSPLISMGIPRPLPAKVLLTPVTFCRLELAGDNAMACLTKVEESTHGEIQLLSPLSNRQIRPSPGTFLKTLNLLNYRLAELTKACYLKLASGRPVLGINKVVLFPNSTNTSEIRLLLIFHEGKLGYWRNGDENWTLLDDRNFHYDDIVIYKGQFYVVDRSGTVYWIDSSLNIIQYSPPLYGCGDRKNLVESCGDLYIVDRYFDGERRKWGVNVGEELNRVIFYNDQFLRRRNFPKCRTETVDVKVYKLDEEWGTWVDVRSLGDRVFVLGNECCFSVSVKEFNNCEGNCIYFTDPNDEDLAGEISGFDARVFRLGDRSIAKASSFHGFSRILCPHLP